MADKVNQNSPNGIDDFKISITAVGGDTYDITSAVGEISLYESIYFPYIHGAIGVSDVSMMLSDFPFVGQEKLKVKWKRDDQEFDREFYITKVSNVTSEDGGKGRYELTVTSEVQVKNSVSLFSKAYSDKGDKIISNVFSEQLGTELSVMDGAAAKTSHSVVFPYLKPLQAVNMVQKSVLGDDDTPIFIYDVLYEDEVRLDTFGRMIAREPIMDIEYFKPSNEDEQGQAYQSLADNRGIVHTDSISRAYNTYDALNRGSFASKVTLTDPSTSHYEPLEFDYESHAPALGSKDFVSSDYTVDGSSVTELFDTENKHTLKNSRAFNDEFPNLNTIDDYDNAIHQSYTRRHAVTVVQLYMDGIAYTPKKDKPFCVGQTVNYNMNRFKPNLSADEDTLDKVNSGKYIISSIRHMIREGEHTMSIEIIRDSVGDEAEL